MNVITIVTKKKIEKYLKENECAVRVTWGEDFCTIFDKDSKAIEDFMIDIEEDSAIYYTHVSYYSVTLKVE